MKLPEKFLENMKALLKGAEYDDFIKSYDGTRYFGIRANTLKIAENKLPKITKGIINTEKKIPWCNEGYYYTDGQPGRSALYHAGVYYIQEPSAMYPGGNVPVKEGDFVLDLCAAPGGKSTQVAARLNGTGLIVSNDISEERTKALVKNIQMAGVVNSIVTNETPEKLSERFENYFDVIITDVPCSGEGMFRKDEEAVAQWESYKAERCRKMQDEILYYADKMLKKGGILSYSTCTFTPKENEETLRAFIAEHNEYYLLDAPKVGGVQSGFDEFEKASRLWPHKVEGEGHFTAFLKKGEAEEAEIDDNARKNRDKKQKKQRIESYKLLNSAPIELREYYDNYMTCEVPDGFYYTMGTNLYYLPVKPPIIDGLKVPMAGLHMGSVQYGEFKMSHRLALTLKPEDFNFYAVFDCDSERVSRYLKGETIEITEADSFFAYGTEYSSDVLAAENIRGNVAVCIKAAREIFVLGLGSLTGTVIKNLYPKGWRRFT